jgi:hypothetical protein
MLGAFGQREMTMKRVTKLAMLCAAALILVASAGRSAAQGGKTLTSDPLTGLPIPPSDDRLHLGNEPEVLPETPVCKSKMQTDFYSPNEVQMNATAAWLDSKLQGFKKSDGWANGRTHITFYKPDGTVMVALTGNPAPQGQDAEVHGIVYAKFTPALSEKAIIGMTVQKIVCN